MDKLVLAQHYALLLLISLHRLGPLFKLQVRTISNKKLVLQHYTLLLLKIFMDYAHYSSYRLEKSTIRNSIKLLNIFLLILLMLVLQHGKFLLETWEINKESTITFLNVEWMNAKQIVALHSIIIRAQ